MAHQAASDILSVSPVIAGATLGRAADNRGGTVTRNPNGQFQHLIDGETAARTINITGVWNFAISDGISELDFF